MLRLVAKSHAVSALGELSGKQGHLSSHKPLHKYCHHTVIFTDELSSRRWCHAVTTGPINTSTNVKAGIRPYRKVGGVLQVGFP